MLRRNNVFLMMLFVLAIAALGACQSNEAPSQVDGSKMKGVDEEYFATYVKVKEGELSGDYFDDYETVPLEDSEGYSAITLKSTGTYEHEMHYYSEYFNSVYREITNKYDYKIKDNEVLRNRDLTEENMKSIEKIYKDDYGDVMVKDEYIDDLEYYDATILKEEDGFVIYDRTNYKIMNSETDDVDNHKEYDFITVEGDFISVNYYEDDDRTRVAVYERVD